MKRAVLAILLVVVFGGAAGVLWWASHRRARKIVFHWDHAMEAGFPDCSATVKKSCVTGFSLTDLTTGQLITANIAVTERSYTYRPDGGIPVGYQHQFALVCNGLDAMGVPAESRPAVVTIRYTWWASLRGEGAVAQ